MRKEQLVLPVRWNEYIHPACDKAEGRWMDFISILAAENALKRHVLSPILVGWIDGTITRTDAFLKPHDFYATTYLGLSDAASGVIIGNLHSPGQAPHIGNQEEHAFTSEQLEYFRRNNCAGVALRPIRGSLPLNSFDTGTASAGKVAYTLQKHNHAETQIPIAEITGWTVHETFLKLFSLEDVPVDEQQFTDNTIAFWETNS